MIFLCKHPISSMIGLWDDQKKPIEAEVDNRIWILSEPLEAKLIKIFKH